MWVEVWKEEKKRQSPCAGGLQTNGRGDIPSARGAVVKATARRATGTQDGKELSQESHKGYELNAGPLGKTTQKEEGQTFQAAETACANVLWWQSSVQGTNVDRAGSACG